MDKQQRFEAFVELGKRLGSLIEEEKFSEIAQKAYHYNNWFTEREVKKAVSAIVKMLSEDALEKWVEQYDIDPGKPVKRVGVVMAGNIPLVGFHDALSVLISGHTLVAKLSSSDNVLIPLIFDLLKENEPAFDKQIIIGERLKDVDMVIATGSDNSARYFHYYFKDLPHIIRKNRNAIAVLTGEESEDELAALGRDIFDYFGLGCRNVSKLYLPENYDLDKLFAALTDYSYLLSESKYMHNYEYYSAVLLLKEVKFLTNNFLILKEDKNIACPVSILNYEYYKDINALNSELTALADQIQCKVSVSPMIESSILPGLAQKPRLWDYADGVDTMKFLMEN